MRKIRPIHPVDAYIGYRLRKRRTACNMSLQALAATVDISYQQLVKYENGTNRISASRLYELARQLDFSPAWFFEGYEEEDTRPG